MFGFLEEIRYGVRLLLRSPGFALVVVLTLSVGIGANTAIFTAINAMLIQPLPAPHSERLVRLYETDLQHSTRGPVSIPSLLDWQHQNEVFNGLAGYVIKALAVQDRSGAEGIRAAAVSPNYFGVLGLSTRLGRSFNSAEDQSGHDHVVILSERLCRRLYASETGIIGKPLQLNGESYLVIGIMPDTVSFPDERTEAWIPLTYSREQLQARDHNWVNVVGRLKDGVSLAQAKQAMSTLEHRLASDYPDALAGRGIDLLSLHEDTVGNTRPTLILLQGTVACMLLIASLNVANLLLARAIARRKEMATRSALGASRARLIRQLLTESTLVGISSGCVGMLLAEWGIELLNWLGKSYLHRLTEVRIDAPVLGFTILASVLVGVIAGLAPVFAVCGKRGTDLLTTLRGDRADSMRGSNGTRRLMVVFEIASAVIMLSCAGLLLRSFWQLQAVRSGVLEPERILTATVRLPPARYQTGESIVDFYSAEQVRVSGLPGVKAAGAINDLPLSGSHDASSFQIDGRPPFPASARPVAENVIVSGNYFEVTGIPLVAGRLFDNRDSANAPRTILINHTFALRFFRNPQDAIGNQIDNGTSKATIVGVVGDARQYSLMKPPAPEIYYPIGQSQDAMDLGENDAQWMTLVMRTEEEPVLLAESLRKAISEIDPGLPLYAVKPWSAVIADSIGDRRLNVWLVGSFALVALFLAALGLYGIVSYGVIQRYREIGVRIALGARRADVIRLVMWDGARMILSGTLIGILCSLGLTRLLQGLLYEVGPHDPATLACVVLLLSGVAFVASYLPARRAATIDPVRSLSA
jgi:putative ABC transport system permease protein